MQHNSLIDKLWSRLLIGFIAGILFRLPVDIIIGLSYKFYTVENWLAYYMLSIASSILLFQLFYLINFRLDKWLNWQKQAKKRFWTKLIIQILVAPVFLLLSRYLFDFIILGKLFYVINFEILNIIVIAFTIVIYNLTELGFHLMNNSKYSLAELERFKKENAEFRFETLMSQVNPHFLFNSLNTLSSLVYENQDTAAKYIRELARVYRYILENKQNELVSLKVDLSFVKAYIYLLELRFKNMISFNFSIEKSKEDLLIAPMTVQMLIENAVKHNIISQKKHLNIKIQTENNSLIIANNIQLRPSKSYSSGIGLSNIKSRYSYFTNDEVEVKETDTLFFVKIPLIHQKDGK